MHFKGFISYFIFYLICFFKKDLICQREKVGTSRGSGRLRVKQARLSKEPHVGLCHRALGS